VAIFKELKMTAAIIDLGTNTFNLLVFVKEGKDFKVIHSERRAVGLGLNGINEKRIADDAKIRALETLKHYKSQALRFNATEFYAYGTSALRDAKNSKDFLVAVKKEIGIEIEVIDGLREADLIYKGVRSVHQFNAPTCTMDIGGGSTEFIFVNELGEITHSQSCNIGVARTIQLFDLSDPLSPENKKQLINYFDENVGDLFDHRNATTLVGASGSFDTFLALTEGDLQPENQSTLFDQKKLLEILSKLIKSSQNQRDKQTEIIDIRKKMIHISALKTQWVIERLGIKEVFVSPASLKEGVMQEIAEGE
jgi:exopolyphosphatase/guanosine-5'-triphosphate,3'-diphosphate pyrophosphatase